MDKSGQKKSSPTSRGRPTGNSKSNPVDSEDSVRSRSKSGTRLAGRQPEAKGPAKPTSKSKKPSLKHSKSSEYSSGEEFDDSVIKHSLRSKISMVTATSASASGSGSKSKNQDLNTSTTYDGTIIGSSGKILGYALPKSSSKSSLNSTLNTSSNSQNS